MMSPIDEHFLYHLCGFMVVIILSCLIKFSIENFKT